MVMGMSHSERNCSQPLKKRRVHDILDNTLLNDSKPVKILNDSKPVEILNDSKPVKILNDSKPVGILNDSKPIEILNESVKEENKENTNILTQNITTSNTPNKKIDIKKETLTNNGVKIETDLNLDLATSVEGTADCNNDNKLNFESGNPIISICKIEDLCGTPKKNVKLQDLRDINDIKTENISSPQISCPNINTNSMEWLSQKMKILSDTPTTCKEEKLNFSNDSTLNRQRKRKFSSDIGDYDELSEVIKSNLCNTDLNDIESIDLLHDLSSVMDFEVNKITNFFCSTTNNTMQSEEELEMPKDPEVDPLFIADNDETDMTSKNTENIKLKQENSRLQVKQETLCDSTTNADTQESHDEDEDIDDDLKDILGISDSNEELTIYKLPKIDKLPKHLMQKLYNLCVELIHEVPPQHKIESSAGSKTLTQKQKKQFLQHGPLKKGQYTPNEDKIIKNNWESFCKVHDWNPECLQPFLNIKYNNTFYIKSIKERQKFVQFLANGLPWRTLFSVYNRFKYLYKNYKRTFKRYTLKEDFTIISHVKKKQKRGRPRKFVELSDMLSRSRNAILHHYRYINRDHQENEKLKRKVNWTLPLVGKFIKVLMNITLSKNVNDLKNAVIPKPVWKKLEQKLKIDYNELKKFWMYRLHMQLFCPEPIYLNDIRIKLIEYVYGKGIAHTREIVWLNVTKYFDGVTSIFLCKEFLRLVELASLQLGTKYFLDIIEHLYHKKITKIKNEATDKFLPRLSYKKGKVNVVDEDLTIIKN